jgi:lysine-specific demethylase 8
VLASYQLPAICRVTSPPEDEIFGLPKKYGDFDLTSAIFIANAGNVGHLHFDGDQRQVFLHQVYGRKRAVLFQPAAAVHLRTLDGPYTRPSLAGVYLEDMSLEQKLELVERLDGYHTVLEPGETLYIPMLMWHHLEYVDDAMSFSVRFGRTRFGRFLSLDNFHRDPLIQNVASKLVGPEPVLRGFDPMVDEIKAEYQRPVADMRQKVREIRALFRRQCAQISPEALPDRLCPPEREEEQVSRIVESKDMQGALKYADPALVAGTRPVGPITARQKEVIQQGVERCGYSREVALAVLYNRVGKSELDELTKSEAAQVISYLASPGAAW